MAAAVRKTTINTITVYDDRGVYDVTPLGRFSKLDCSRIKRVLTANDTSSESSQRHVSNDDLFGTETIPIVEISSMENRPRGGGVTYAVTAVYGNTWYLVSHIAAATVLPYYCCTRHCCTTQETAVVIESTQHSHLLTANCVDSTFRFTTQEGAVPFMCAERAPPRISYEKIISCPRSLSTKKNFATPVSPSERDDEQKQAQQRQQSHEITE